MKYLFILLILIQIATIWFQLNTLKLQKQTICNTIASSEIDTKERVDFYQKECINTK